MERSVRRFRNWMAVVFFLVVVGTAKEAYAWSMYFNQTFSTEEDCLNGVDACRNVCASHSEPYGWVFCPYDPISHTYYRYCMCGFPDGAE